MIFEEDTVDEIPNGVLKSKARLKKKDQVLHLVRFYDDDPNAW